MIGLDVFLIGMLGVSIFTGLATEAVKNVLVEHDINYKANTLAGVVALILSAVVGGGYIILADVVLTSKIAVCWIALVFVSWLCAMVGYDKVVQAISQFKTIKKEN